MYLDNKYTVWYYNIINRAKSRTLSSEIYTENHHIIPECFFKIRNRKGPSGWLDGDSESSENKVLLTAKEHVICHRLLVKMTDEVARIKMNKAVVNMIGSRKYRITSRQYELLKIEFSKSMSGDNNPMHDPIAKKKQTLSKQKTMSDPIRKENHRQSVITAKRDPKTKEKFNKIMSSDKHREVCRRSSLKAWNNISRRLEKSKKSIGKNNPAYDHTIYRWTHVSGIIEHCTRHDLKIKYELSQSKLCLVVKNINQSHRGWRIIPNI